MADEPRLTDPEIDEALGTLVTWRREGDALVASYTLASFPLGIELVDLVATSAEAAGHHPDIDIRWRTITFRLTTHDAGGITGKDVNLARRIESHATGLDAVAD